MADRVVVKEGGSRWQAESGQYLLAFEGDPADGSLSVIECNDAEQPASAEDWFDRGVALESRDVEAALQAYERAVAADAALIDAHINLGLLLHQAGSFAKAERVYRDAIRANGSDPVLLYNLGVCSRHGARTSGDRRGSAARRSRSADCHYTSRFCEDLRTKGRHPHRRSTASVDPTGIDGARRLTRLHARTRQHLYVFNFILRVILPFSLHPPSFHSRDLYNALTRSFSYLNVGN